MRGFIFFCSSHIHQIVNHFRYTAFVFVHLFKDFLWGFVREQVEEEATASGIVDMIKRAGATGVFFVDVKLGER